MAEFDWYKYLTFAILVVAVGYYFYWGGRNYREHYKEMTSILLGLETTAATVQSTSDHLLSGGMHPDEVQYLQKALEEFKRDWNKKSIARNVVAKMSVISTLKSANAHVMHCSTLRALGAYRLIKMRQ